jgi:hypothetical protein
LRYVVGWMYALHLALWIPSLLRRR